VSGGAGYVGSHVCKALAGHGYEPVCVDTLENGYRWAVQWGPLETVDTRDEAGLAEVFATHRPIAVMHCTVRATSRSASRFASRLPTTATTSRGSPLG
jgi:UDP-glucose 4-epimerase